jgi:hypothetical protein
MLLEACEKQRSGKAKKNCSRDEKVFSAHCWLLLQGA